MCECQPKTRLTWNIIYCSVGIVLGIAVSLVFGVHFHNRHAAGWGLGSSLFSAIALIQFLYLYNQTEVKGAPPHGLALALFGIAGSIAMAIGIGGIGTYLGLGIIDSRSDHEPSLPHSHYVVCVWCFMNFKWGFTLYWYALKAFRQLSTVASAGYRPISGKYT